MDEKKLDREAARSMIAERRNGELGKGFIDDFVDDLYLALKELDEKDARIAKQDEYVASLERKLNKLNAGWINSLRDQGLISDDKAAAMLTYFMEVDDGQG
jgi:hypothetical protein